MRLCCYIVIALFSLMRTALATYVPTTVIEVPTLNDLRSVAVSGTSPNTTPSVANVRAYSTTGDGGGGTFVVNGTSCADDGGVVIQETGSPTWCWYRQFTGPVHLPWYGVADASNSSCYSSGFPAPSCDATAKLQAAFNASLTYGDGGVTTDGRSIALLSPCSGCSSTTAAVIPVNQYLTCAGPQGARRDWLTGSGSSHYWTAPSSIVLAPSLTIMRLKNTRFSDCFIRPNWLYQGNMSPVIPPANVADTVQMTHNFKGTATTCTDDVCSMDHMMIVGFDTCDEINASNKAVITNIVEDCMVNEWVHNSGGGAARLHGITADRVLEGSLDNTVQMLSWPITNVVQSGTDNVIVQVDTTLPSCGDPQLQTSGNDTVMIDGLGLNPTFGSPVSANGRWLTTSVAHIPSTCTYSVTLTGASWAGPTFANISWTAGSSAISSYDTTNVIPGQYVCETNVSSVPFCTPPAGFIPAPGITLTATLASGVTGTIQVSGGPLAGWPLSGLAKIENEIVAYTIVDATDIDLTARGIHGTTAALHNSGKTITAAAPTVVGADPISDVVIVSTAATLPGSRALVFANDPTLWNPGLSSFTYGTLYLNPGHHTWTANAGAGGRPSSALTVYAGGSTTGGVLGINPTHNCFKIQPGMAVADLSTTPSTSLGHVVTVNCSATPPVVTVSGSSAAFSSDKIQFSGCGYPATMPWLGNCAATGILLGGTGASDEVQGAMCDTIYSLGSEIAIHSLNAAATQCTNMILDLHPNDGGDGDPDAVALWIDGIANNSQYSNGRLSGADAILDSPAPANQPDGIGISNMQVGGSIVFGDSANATLAATHGLQTALAAPFVFASSGVNSAHLTGSILPIWTVEFGSLAALSNLYCSAQIV